VIDCCLAQTLQFFSYIMAACPMKINVRENWRCNQLWTV